MLKPVSLAFDRVLIDVESRSPIGWEIAETSTEDDDPDVNAFGLSPWQDGH